MKYIVIALLLLVSGSVSGQFEDQEFGVISQKEIDMESYPEDPESGAVVLFDKGKSVFFDYRGAYDIRFTRHKRIKNYSITQNSIMQRLPSHFMKMVMMPQKRWSP
ncbi:hypothetical protein L21SP5_03145 [Salinivirga cyanobacteriivorans]|uniref:Uncharacterized protein n=1 Tax=Salinivirga cyanobacteriivorans TaxID=1307839 RepID=A0A0S2I2W2_9BACT|nr:hypothetical protein [Salinivirga cyanobacteriivorans]ALO16760.1 hypothetical protein L21SP5_03145 [Salinivirga cyanobacteriivorans]